MCRVGVVCDISGEGCLDEMREGRVEWTNGDGVVSHSQIF